MTEDPNEHDRKHFQRLHPWLTSLATAYLSEVARYEHIEIAASIRDCAGKNLNRHGSCTHATLHCAPDNSEHHACVPSGSIRYSAAC